MIEQRIDGSLAAIDQIDHALGQPGLIEQFKGAAHGERHALRGLEDERVAAGDGVGQKPERNHAREIERRDGRDHAQRLADHHFVDAAGNVFEVVALHHHGNAAGDFDVLDGAAQLGFGLGESLAVFLRDDAAEFVDVLFEKIFSLNSGWMRSSGGVRRHAGNAAAAASTAALTSAASESGALAMISPVAGLMTSSHSLAVDSTHWPLM